MAQSTHKVVHPESTYDVIELIGTSTKSWEDAAKNAVEEAGKLDETKQRLCVFA